MVSFMFHKTKNSYKSCLIPIFYFKLCIWQVTWVQRKHNSDKLQLLTVGNHTYSADTRFSVDFQYPNNWRLKITGAIVNDEGIYECQISTHPPRLYRVFLTVNGKYLFRALIEFVFDICGNNRERKRRETMTHMSELMVFLLLMSDECFRYQILVLIVRRVD